MTDPINIQATRVARDRRLRRRLLGMLYEARSSPDQGYVAARVVGDSLAFAPLADRIEDDRHLLSLLRDLVRKDMAEERDDRQRKTQPFGLDYLSYRILSPGLSLLEEGSRPDPDIEDERIIR